MVRCGQHGRPGRRCENAVITTAGNCPDFASFENRNRAPAEHSIEELRRDNAGQYSFRARIGLPRDAGMGYSGHALKAGALVAPVQEIRR